MQQLKTQESHLTSRNDCFLFVLKVHRGDKTTSAVEFAAETSELVELKEDGNPIIDNNFELPEIDDLRTILQSIKMDADEERDWNSAGALWRSGTTSDIHRLFYNTQTTFSIRTNLRDIVMHPDFKRKTKPRPRLELCKLLAPAHLYFSDTRDSCPA